jgi:hypothetical protein
MNFLWGIIAKCVIVSGFLPIFFLDKKDSKNQESLMLPRAMPTLAR